MTHFIEHYGLWFLFAIVCLESAGLWLPGESALITAAVLAAQHRLAIAEVIVVAAVAAIIGDNIGYWIGRKAARPLMYRYERVRRYAERVLPPAERFFKRHGGKAVFLARFFGGIRVTAAWIAGITEMSWWRFLFWNAAGGIAWALGVGLLAYYAGKAVADALARYGLYAAVGGALAIVVVVVVVHLWRRRVVEENA